MTIPITLPLYGKIQTEILHSIPVHILINAFLSSVLIKLLHSCAESNVPSKYEELVMKCLWKIVKTMSNWAPDLDYDTILLEVHRFLKVYIYIKINLEKNRVCVK